MTKRSIYGGHPKNMENNAEVAQPGRALDPLLFCSGGEAEDRVVAGSNPALGTIELSLEENARIETLSLFLRFGLADNQE